MVAEFPDQVNGYIVVPVIISSQTKTTSTDSPVYHTLYLKKHEVRRTKNQQADNEAGSDDEDAEEQDLAQRTVFVVNLPAITTFDHIKTLCQDAAGVIAEDFKFDVGGNTGRIVLVDKASAARLISKAKHFHKLDKKREPLVWNSKNSNSYGLKKYITKSLQKFPDHDDLQRRVDLYMANFNKAEARELSEVRSLAGQVDADGFTMVVSSKRKSRADMAAPTTMTQEELLQTVAKNNKKRPKEKKDFYRFQIREQKKQEMNSLLKRFKEDQEKVKELREKKRFRPY